MPYFVIDNVKKILENAPSNVISVFGLAYKGNSDDDRESPSYEIIRNMNNDCEIRVYDPHLKDKSLSFEEALKDSSLILVLTDHDEFKHLDFEKIASLMKKPTIFDTKNIIDKEDMPENFTLYNFGNISNL